MKMINTTQNWFQSVLSKTETVRQMYASKATNSRAFATILIKIQLNPNANLLQFIPISIFNPPSSLGHQKYI